MKAKLAISEPFVVSLNHHAFPTSIVKTLGNHDWLYNKYIQLYFDTQENTIDYEYDYFFYKTTALVKGFMSIPHSCLEKQEILKLTKNIVFSGGYIYGNWNEFYIEGTSSFMKQLFRHNFFIYGYDDDKEELNAAGYLDDGYYHNFSVKYDNFVQSLDLKREYVIYDIAYINRNFVQDFDISLVEKSIKEYLDSSPVDMRREFETQPNIQEGGIDALCKHFVSQRHSTDKIHIPRVFLLWEHKKLMHERLQKINNECFQIPEDYLNSYLEVYNAFKTVLSLSIKYNLSRQKGIKEKIYDIEMKNTERELQILSCIFK